MIPTLPPNARYQQSCYPQAQSLPNIHVPTNPPMLPLTLPFSPPMTGAPVHLVPVTPVYGFDPMQMVQFVNFTTQYPTAPLTPCYPEMYLNTFPEMSSLSSNSSDCYSTPSPNGSSVDSGSSFYVPQVPQNPSQPKREFVTVQVREDINAELNAIAERLFITPETINGVILDSSKYQSNYSEMDVCPVNPILSIVLRDAMVNGQSFKLSWEWFDQNQIDAFDGFHICAEINGNFVLAKMACADNGHNVWVSFVSQAEQFNLIPGLTLYVVSSNVEENLFNCRQQGLRYGLLVTDESQVVRGTLDQPFCEQVIIQSQKALMLSSIFISKFVNENKDGILRMHFIPITDRTKIRNHANVGMRCFMHMHSEDTRTKFKALLDRFPHLSKSTTQLYKADKNIERTVEYHQQIFRQGDEHLLNTQYMQKWYGMHLQSPKTAQQMLAYFARLGAIYPISGKYLSDIKHLELSLKYLAENRCIPLPQYYPDRCSKALCGSIELIGTEGDEECPGSKILKKIKGAIEKVKRSILSQIRRRANDIRDIDASTHSAQQIKDLCCRIYLSNSRNPSRTVYWKNPKEDGTFEYKTKKQGTQGRSE